MKHATSAEVPELASPVANLFRSRLGRIKGDHVVVERPLDESGIAETVIVSDALGVIVVEVVPWDAHEIHSGGWDELKVRESEGSVRSVSHPERRGERVLEWLRDGLPAEELVFPMTHLVVLPRIGRFHLESPSLCIPRVFRSPRVVTSDELREWFGLENEALLETWRGFFPSWSPPARPAGEVVRLIEVLDQRIAESEEDSVELPR